MHRFKMFLFALATTPWLVGCAEEPKTPAERVQVERKDVEEVRDDAADAQKEVAEQRKELADAKAEVAEQERELAAAEDEAGDAARQLEKEKADLRAAESAAGPKLPPAPK